MFRLLADDQPARLRDWAVDLLSDIASGAQCCAAVQHPLNFFCFPVSRVGTEGICIHHWAPDRPPIHPEEDFVHSHSWDLVSHVLLGQVRNETFLVQDVGDGSELELYRVTTGESYDEIASTGRRILSTTVGVDRVEAGVTYALDAGTFHRTCSAGGAVVTIVAGRDVSPQQNLFVGPAGQPRLRKRRDILSIEESAALATRLTELLTSS